MEAIRRGLPPTSITCAKLRDCRTDLLQPGMRRSYRKDQHVGVHRQAVRHETNLRASTIRQVSVSACRRWRSGSDEQPGALGATRTTLVWSAAVKTLTGG